MGGKGQTWGDSQCGPHSEGRRVERRRYIHCGALVDRLSQPQPGDGGGEGQRSHFTIRACCCGVRIRAWSVEGRLTRCSFPTRNLPVKWPYGMNRRVCKYNGIVCNETPQATAKLPILCCCSLFHTYLEGRATEPDRTYFWVTCIGDWVIDVGWGGL